jgi:hypothetical protein
MGLLDDAIREHLELKRRRGADATEISRQETDALGPVRRSPEGVPDLSDLAPAEGSDGGALAPAASAPPSPWEETEIHTPPPAPSYQPQPGPPAAAAPPLPPEPPDAASEPTTAEDPTPPSLLSRLNPAAGRMRSRRATDEPPGVPLAETPPAAHEPVPPPPPADAPRAPAPVHAATPYPPPADEPDIVPADEEPEGEELLEETPEFLEETPDHDRLWFEQRPPRDFDFDG